MNKIIVINDICAPQDTMTHGHVNIYDPQMDKVVDKSNMIVLSGRKNIRDAVRSQLLNNSAKVKVGDAGVIPTYAGMTIANDALASGHVTITDATFGADPYLSADSEGNLMVDGELYHTADGSTVAYASRGAASTYAFPDEDSFIRVVADISRSACNNMETVSDLMITTGNDAALFSRVCFEKQYLDVTIDADSNTVEDSYTLIYYIYF